MLTRSYPLVGLALFVACGGARADLIVLSCGDSASTLASPGSGFLDGNTIQIVDLSDSSVYVSSGSPSAEAVAATRRHGSMHAYIGPASIGFFNPIFPYPRSIGFGPVQRVEIDRQTWLEKWYIHSDAGDGGHGVTQCRRLSLGGDASGMSGYGVNAATMPAPWLRQMPGIRAVQSATVVIAAPFGYREHVDEDFLKKFGCAVKTQAAARMTALVEILERARLAPYEGREASFDEQEYREAVYLSLEDGTELKFLFGQRFTGRNNIRGAFSNVRNAQGTRITAGSTLAQELLRWALATGAPTSPGMQGECGLFFDNPKYGLF